MCLYAIRKVTQKSTHRFSRNFGQRWFSWLATNDRSLGEFPGGQIAQTWQSFAVSKIYLFHTNAGKFSSQQMAAPIRLLARSRLNSRKKDL